MTDTLSVQEVNKMRIAMGLKPIPVPGEGGLDFQQESKEDVEEGDLTLDERQERGSANWAKLDEEKKKREEREERKKQIAKAREQAARNAVLKGSGIAEVEDDLGATDWLKSMKKRHSKIERDEQAKMEAERKEVQAQYTSASLAGMRVAHQLDSFGTDEAILTFKDQGVDEGDSEDEFELENRELRDQEALKRNLEAKKFKPGAVYNPNEEQNGLLSQYDEAKQSNFTIDQMGQAREEQDGSEAQDEARSKGVMVSLADLLDEKQPTSDYKEIKAPKPKKVKKSKNARKRARDDEDDIFPAMDIDLPATAPKAKKRNVESAIFDDDEDLQLELSKARRQALKARKKPSEIAKQIKEEDATQMDDVQATIEGEDGGLLIDASTEWANSLDPEAVAREAAEEEERRRRREASHHTPKPDVNDEEDADEDEPMGYAEADEAEEAAERAARTPSAPAPEISASGIGDEEGIGDGIAQTLKMLKDRNLVEGASNTSNNFRERQRFLMERSKREEDAEFRARQARAKDRERMQGMSNRDREEAARQANSTRDFAESRALADLFNKEYKPNVNLSYTDEFGNSLDAKQAFKHLSHQFHGKGSGKQKQEKRLKKLDEEKKRMSASMLDASQFAAGAGDKRKNKQAGVRLQ